MRLWAFLWVLVVAAVGVFSFLNWQVLTAQTSMNLLIAQVIAPLGLVMLGAMAAVALMFLLFLVWLETSTLLQIRSSSSFAGRLDHLEQVLRDEIGRVNSTLLARADSPDAQPFKKLG